jgi:competence protein ComEA
VVLGDARPPGSPRRAQPGGRSSLDDELRAAELDDLRSPASIEAGEPQSPRSACGKSDSAAAEHHGTAWTTVVFRLGRAHAGALTVLLVVAVVLTGSRLTAARGHELDTVSATPVLTPAASVSSPTPSPVPLRVHVMGAVVAPGVVSVPAGSRVADAIAAAGGLARDADCAELNLAAELPDGAQIVIGTTADPRGEMRTGQADSTGGSGSGTGGSGAGGSGGAATGGGTSSSTVNLNTATAAQLETLPGVGPVMAQRIIDWRTANGGFTRVEELQEVDGIGAKTYAKLAPLVHV